MVFLLLKFSLVNIINVLQDNFNELWSQVLKLIDLLHITLLLAWLLLWRRLAAILLFFNLSFVLFKLLVKLLRE
jgi:hypothetical protein